jgi:hypothetical protein
MRSRLLGSFLAAVLAVSIAGCPEDPDGGTPDARRDIGQCVFVDVGPSAPDGNEPDDADADATIETGSDAGTDGDATVDASDATDATIDTADAAVDVTLDTADATVDTKVDATSEVASDTALDGDVADTAFDTMAREFDAGPPVPRSAVDAIINLSCTFSSCHGRLTGVGGLVLYKTGVGDWYPNLVGVVSQENPSMKYVDPGNPAGSWLAHKIVGDNCMYTAQCKDRDCGDQMPAANDPLDADDIRTILDWIRQGAKPK